MKQFYILFGYDGMGLCVEESNIDYRRYFSEFKEIARQEIPFTEDQITEAITQSPEYRFEGYTIMTMIKPN